MKNVLALLVVPPTDLTVEEYAEKALAPHRANARVKPYVMRHEAEGFLPNNAPRTVVAVEEGSPLVLHDLNPTPKFDTWTVGGRYAGCLKPTSEAEGEIVNSKTLSSVEYNSVFLKDFKFTFVPGVLIMPDGSWVRNLGDRRYENNRWALKMRSLLNQTDQQSKLVVLDLMVSTNTERITTLTLM